MYKSVNSHFPSCHFKRLWLWDPISFNSFKDFSSFLLAEITTAFSSSSVTQTLKLALVILQLSVLKKSWATSQPSLLSPFCQKDWIIVRAIAFNSGFYSQYSTQSIVVTISHLVSSDWFPQHPHPSAASQSYHSSLQSWQGSHLTNGQQFVFLPPPQPLYLKVFPRVRCSVPFYSPLTCFPLIVSHHHILHFHCYADAIQLYISTRSITAEIHSALGTMPVKSPNHFPSVL